VIRLSVTVRGDDAGVVLAELLELSPAGVEEREAPGGVEYAIYGAPGELPALPQVEAAAGGVLVSVATEEVPDDWDERWKAWHRPVVVTGGGRRLRVRPPWEPAEPGVLDLVIDPGQAFGTGAHATTRLCLELLLELEPRGALADWGCGTGVLAIAAAQLGFEPVTAVDADPLALEATRANAGANGVALARIARADLREAAGPWAPTVCANLLRPLLLDVARRMERPPERLIASGLLRHEADDVAAAFTAHGLLERDRRHCAEWSALRLDAL
jgi:ribosomal protein L11 methyltransferase